MYGLHTPPSWVLEPSNPLILLVSFKVDMLFLIWTKFEENLSIGFVSWNLQGVSKSLLESGAQYIAIFPFSFDFSGCLTRRIINAARIVLFKSKVYLKSFVT